LLPLLILGLDLAAVAPVAWGESPYLVRDLSPGGDELVSVEPRGLLTAGRHVFFCADVSGFGYGPPTPSGLWASDGTASGTQLLGTTCYGSTSDYTGTLGQLLYFGAGSLWRSDGTRAGTFPLTTNGLQLVDDILDNPPQHAVLGNVLYFAACAGGGDCNQLWRSDGTLGGTTLVADLTPSVPAGAGGVRGLTPFAGRLYFLNPFLGDGLAGLWRSDGTGAGTLPVTALDGNAPSLLAAAGKNLFLVAYGSPQGVRQLWVTDGIADPHPLTRFTSFDAIGDTSSGSGWLKAIGDRVTFVAKDGNGVHQLWVSDGTVAGTAAVTGFSNPQAFEEGPDQVELVGTRLLFFGSDGVHPSGLWATSGTPQSTTSLCSGNCDAATSTRLVKAGARVVFLTGSFDDGFGLWSSDGTAAGTALLVQACAPNCFAPPSLQVAGGRIFFPVLQVASGDLELWQTDGTPAGTHPYAGGLIANTLNTGIDSLEVAALDNRLVFSAPDSGGGVELWATDGTAAGTRQLTDASVPSSSLPQGLVPFGNLVFFSAGSTYPDQNPRLWQSAGTAATTSQVPGVAAGVGPPIAAAASCVFFPQGGQLWRADGTAAGSVQLTNLPSDQALGPLVSYQGNLAFVVLSPSATSLWHSDGTPQGTVKLLDLPIPSGAQFDKLSTAGGLLFYTTLDPTQFTPPQVWRSDGTVAGTYALASKLYLDSATSAPIAVGGWTYFIGSQPGALGLWRTDGTVAGTAPVLPPAQLAADDLTALTDLGGVLYFLAGRSGFGWTLWRSDGTPGGTVPIRQITSPEGYVLPAFAAVGNQLFFTVDDGMHGNELWASDGSAAGTRLVRDVNPGPSGSRPTGLVAAGGRLFFSADDGVHGPELWESDGTAAGTFLVQDIWPGPPGSGPAAMTQAGDLLFFSADDGLTGRELWALPLAGSTLCRPAPTALCLLDDRFKVEAFWRDFQGNSGPGQAVGLTPDTGYFWFFSPDSVEVIGKVIDGRPLNASFWFFYGALSSVEYSLTVTDTMTGAARRYLNPLGQLASVGDTTAFGPQGAFTILDPGPDPAGAGAAPKTLPGDPAPAASPPGQGPPPALARPAPEDLPQARAACHPGAATLCLDGGRFAASVRWQDFSGRQGAGMAVPLTADTGSFWFFSQANVELVVKLLDGRALNGKFWVFFGALSDVAYTVTVQDTLTGRVRTYTNPAGRFASVADTMAF
jgi:ELWxxDGT repeat protein